MVESLIRKCPPFCCFCLRRNSIMTLPALHVADRRLIATRKLFQRMLKPQRLSNHISPETAQTTVQQIDEVHPVERFASFLSGAWEGESVCTQSDDTWLPWGHTSFSYSVLSQDSGLISVRGTGLSSTASAKVKYTVTGTIDLRRRKVVLSKARADRCTFYHTTRPSQTGHFPIPSLILHQEPGLEQAVISRYDSSLVETEYVGALGYQNGAVIIRGQCECGTFTLVKRLGLRQQKESKWAGKCLANTVVELRLKSPIGSPPPPSPPAQVVHVGIESARVSGNTDIKENKHHGDLLAFPVDYELLYERKKVVTS